LLVTGQATGESAYLTTVISRTVLTAIQEGKSRAERDAEGKRIAARSCRARGYGNISDLRKKIGCFDEQRKLVG
jgi:hypothetical protein